MNKRRRRQEQRRKVERRATLWVVGLIVLIVMIFVGGALLADSPSDPAETIEPVSSQVNTPANVQRITPADAWDLVQRGKAVLYDTRSAESFDVSHAAGALSIPEEDAPELVSRLPKDKALIFYCT